METLPKYQAILEDILQKIQSEDYPPDARLPSENQMAELYGTSVPTVRRALHELVYQKAIYRIKGNGTFVAGADAPEAEGALGAGAKEPAKTICFLMLADRSDSSVMKMIRGAQSYLTGKGYSMTILCGKERAESEADLLHECLKNNAGGVLMFSEDPDANLESLRLLKKNHIDMVMLDRGPKQMPFTLVSAYNLDGGYQMAQHLLQLGHEHIAFVADRVGLAAEKDRIRGYELALEEAGLPFDEGLVLSRTADRMDELMRLIKEKEVTAVQCVNDKVAMQVIRRLDREGYSVPTDISVSGFDGSDEAEYTNPRITTIIQPFEEMGRIAASRLLALMAGKTSHTQTYVSVQLDVKDSTAGPRPKETGESS